MWMSWNVDRGRGRRGPTLPGPLPRTRRRFEAAAFAVAAAWLIVLADCGDQNPGDPVPVVAEDETDDAAAWEPDPIPPEEVALAQTMTGRDSVRLGDASLDVARRVAALSRWYGVDPRLVARLIYVESRGDPDALGPPITIRVRGSLVRTRAVGLGQIVPEIWDGSFPECGRDLTSVRTNVCYTVRVWRHYRERFPGDPTAALLAYNGCVSDHCAWYAGAVLGDAAVEEE